jgi:hypothetical protein
LNDAILDGRVLQGCDRLSKDYNSVCPWRRKVVNVCRENWAKEMAVE